MKTVFVGLSGGVDSATSLALLKQQGFSVVGAFIKIWQPEFIECTWREDRLDALRICASLDVPFREVDLSDEYKREVVDQMVADYTRGITPNPDVLCNEHIKFGVFMKWALAQGADLLATGHYAQVKKVNGRAVLTRGVDTNKDQSYFLHRISEAELNNVLFPIGALHKTDVRKRAIDFTIPVASKADSQGLCFVGDVSMRDFLRRYISVEHGPVFNISGAVVGEHEGAALYTIGQRHGFTTTNAPDGTAHYVTAIDTNKNSITVSPHRQDATKGKIQLRDMHWIGEPASFPFETMVQTRYREVPVRATLTKEGSVIMCTFDDPHLVSAGQSLVMYEGEVCLGGGIIQVN